MCFKNVGHFAGNALYRPECMLEERLSFLREMPFIIVLHVLKELVVISGNSFYSSFVMCFKSVWHFTGNAYYRRL